LWDTFAVTRSRQKRIYIKVVVDKDDEKEEEEEERSWSGRVRGEFCQGVVVDTATKKYLTLPTFYNKSWNDFFSFLFFANGFQMEICTR
jgi:hypothetical protein